MESQPSLFYDRVENAIDAVISACGGRKAFSCAMWPDKPPRDAHNLLDACLNHERRERFSPAQLLYIMKRGREVGCHAVAQFMGVECGYDFTPITPATERDRLADAIMVATTTLKHAMRVAESIPQARAVK